MSIELCGTPFLVSSAATAWARLATPLVVFRRCRGAGVAVDFNPGVLHWGRIVGGILDHLAGTVGRVALTQSKKTG